MEGGVVVRKPDTGQNATERPTCSLTHLPKRDWTGGGGRQAGIRFRAWGLSPFPSLPVTPSFTPFLGILRSLGISRYTVTCSLSWAWETLVI